MKTNKIIIITLMSLIILSCKDDDGLQIGSYGIANDIINSRISVFDKNSDISIKLNGSNQTQIQSVEIFKEGTKVSDATLNNDGSRATFSSSVLGDFNFNGENTGSYNISVKSTATNGVVIENNHIINVVNSLNFISENPSYIYKDTLNPSIIFSTFTLSAKVDNVTVDWKKGKSGTYQDIMTSTPLKVARDSIKLKTLDLFNQTGIFNLVQNDTLYLKFTATSGTLVDTLVTSVVIDPQPISTTGLGSFSDKSLYFNLVKGSNVKQEKDSEIKFIATSNTLIFSSIPDDPETTTTNEAMDVDINFVEITSSSPSIDIDDIYSDDGVYSMREAYNSGTASNTITLGNNKLYAYKIVREVDKKSIEYFGYILTRKENVVDGDKIYYFDYKEGTVIE